VLPTMRCIANSDWTGPISDLPMDDTGEVRTKRSLNRQADAKAGTDQAFDAFAAYIMSHHFWPVCWRGKSGDNHVMNLMSGITLALQKRFALEVSPILHVGEFKRVVAMANCYGHFIGLRVCAGWENLGRPPGLVPKVSSNQAG
jgi:hypothetical protein